MSKRINLNELIYIIGQPREWIVRNINKFGYETREGKYFANAKGLEKYLIYSSDLDLKENTLYKRLNKKRRKF